MDHFCVRLETFNEEAIREHLVHYNVEGSKLETRYGAEGNGPSIYIQDPEGNTVELKGPAIQ
jgi:catechol-2,3-dioxygenase